MRTKAKQQAAVVEDAPVEEEAMVEETPAEEAAALDPELVAAGAKVFKKCKACHQVGRRGQKQNWSGLERHCWPSSGHR